MFKWKKQISVCLCMLMATLILFGGCTKKEPTPSSTTPQSKENNQSATQKTDDKTEALEPYDLIWYTIGTPQRDSKMVMEELSKYTKEKINSNIDMRLIDWGDYTQKMQILISSGEPFDITFTCSWANDYLGNATKGAFVELSELLDTYGKGTKELLHPGFFKGAEVNGGLYAVPTNKELGWQSVFRFNKKYVDKYNLDISTVDSLESLEPLLKVIKENEPDIQALVDFTPFLPFDAIITDNLPFAISLDSNDYKVINTYDTPEIRQALATMRKYYEAGYIRVDAATASDNDYVTTGKWFADKAHTQPYADLLWSNSAGYEIVSVPMHEPFVNNSSATGSMQAISVTSDNPERAMMFLELLNTDPYVRNMVDSGIEGVHYELVNGRQKDLPAASEGYNMPTFSLGNLFITHLYEGDPEDKWEAFQEFNDSSFLSPLLGFNLDLTPIRTELAAIQNVSEEYSKALFTGSVDPDEYLPKALEKFKAAGSDKVIEEIQRQIDAWRATQ